MDDVDFTGIHHVQLAIPPDSEVERRRFYGELVGMAELVKPPALAARGRVLVPLRRLGGPRRCRDGVTAVPGTAVTRLVVLLALIRWVR